MGSKEACKFGHPLSGANLILRDTGHGIARTCRTCLQERTRRYRAEQRAGRITPRREVGGALEVKLAARSRIEGECRIWTGPTDKKGYPVLTYQGKERRVRKYLYELRHAPLKGG